MIDTSTPLGKFHQMTGLTQVVSIEWQVNTSDKDHQPANIWVAKDFKGQTITVILTSTKKVTFLGEDHLQWLEKNLPLHITNPFSVLDLYKFWFK